MNRDFTVTFKLNEPQWESMKKLAEMINGWSHADLRIRKDGEYHWFEVDWLQAIKRQVELEMGA